MKNYIKISAIEVSQLNSKSGAVYTGRITFKELLGIQKLTERIESTHDPISDIPIQTSIEDQEFQRHLNKTKLNSIARFLDKELNNGGENIIFPSSVILSLRLDENNKDDNTEEFIDSNYVEGSSTCFVVPDNNSKCSNIYIPKTQRICLIVDGQHRFYGLKNYYDKITSEKKKAIIEGFDFVATILLGYDSYQVAEVFANVNFNQKPVNKSLYYDIFGSSASSKNEIQLAHFLALHLQNSTDSPINGMIKLLGKGNGMFSQAFFVEKLIVHFKDKGVWNDIYMDYIEGGKEYQKIAVFLKQYFKAISEYYNDCWPIKQEREGEMVYSPFIYDYILSKTTGMGAFFRLIKDIYPICNSLEYVEQICKDIFLRDTENRAKMLFSKNGQYGKGGSEGMQVRLYNDLKKLYCLI